MKILLINYMETTAPGGINKAVREIAKNLSEIGHGVIVLQANPLNLPDEEVYEGFKIIRVKSRFGSYFYGLSPAIHFYLKKHFKELNPDIVHIHGSRTLFPWEALFSLRKIISFEGPVLFSPHFDLFGHETLAGRYFWPPYVITVGKRISKYASLVVAVSEFEADCIHDYVSISKDRIIIIPHGVDILHLNTSKMKRGHINLLYVGYLIKHKGVQYILESLHELRYNLEINDVRLTIIGEGPYKNVLTDIDRKLKINEFVSWRGFISKSELLEEYRKANIFLLLSRSEAYAIVIAEALASGIPCIVTKTTALTEFLNESGCFGIDYPPDPKKLARLIIKIHESDVKVGPFSDKIRTWDKVAEDYEKVYYEVLSKSD